MYVLKGELKVVSIDRDSFKRLLGPLDDILKRNFVRYEKYTNLA
jgi:cAMP-dependent protein kinase regulator